MDPANNAGRARARGRARGRARQPETETRRPGDVNAPTAAVNVAGSLSGNMSSLSVSERGEVAGRGATRGHRDISGQVQLPAPRSGGQKQGSGGQPLSVVSNYYRLDDTIKCTIFFYHLDFSPDIEHKKLRRVLIGNQRPLIGNVYLFDGGSSLYLPKRLPEKEMEVVSKLRNGDSVKINIKFARELATNDPIVLQIMNVQMRRNMQHLDFQLLGRYYYDQKASQVVHDVKMEIWPGFITSIRQHDDAVMLMVEHTSKVLRQDTVLDQLGEIIRNSRSQNVQQEVKRQLLGAIVMTTYNKNTYRIDDISFNDNPKSTFKKKEEDISYVDYYKNNWDIQIKHLDQPLIISRPSRRDQKVGRNENYYLVPELCCMTGLTDDMRANFQLTRKLNEITRKGPNERVRILREFMSRVKMNQKCVEEMRGWGLVYNERLVSVNARQLEPENIFMHNSRFLPQNGDWTRGLRENVLHHCIPCKNWIIVCPKRNENIVSTLVTSLRRVERSMGLSFSNPNCVFTQDNYPRSYIEAIRKNAHPSTEMVVCILPGKNKSIYDAVKKYLTCENPIPSQCIVAKTLINEKKALSAVTKIAIQMNVKLGGAAWHVAIPLKQIMFMGYDTYHDSSQRGKSVGAFISTADDKCTKWHSSVSFQYSHEEIASKMKPMVVSALRNYAKKNKDSFPERYVMYRDGVSDGQINQLIESEVNVMIETIKEMTQIEQPKLCYIIVNKRINTRFFQNSNNGYVNPPPGCVVDNTVTKPERYDFFLVSQSVNQGTVSPTQFIIVSDTLGMKPEHNQRLAYKMTHMYYNWPGTVRVPAPCQYAHKLAFLVGQSTHKAHDPKLADSLFFL